MKENLFVNVVIKEQNYRLMSCNEFANFLGISAPTLYSIKKNKAIFSKTARKICDKLNITDKKVIASINIKYYS